MKSIRVLVQIVILLGIHRNSQAWQGDPESFNGPIGEYVKTLKGSFREGETSIFDREEQRLLKKGDKKDKKKTAKTPAPTVTVTSAPTCPPTRFVPTKKGAKKRALRTKKGGKGKGKGKANKSAKNRRNSFIPIVSSSTPVLQQQEGMIKLDREHTQCVPASKLTLWKNMVVKISRNLLRRSFCIDADGC